MSTVAREAYAARLFVGREKQINKVLDKARELCQNRSEPSKGRVTIFSGEVGMGKTWLLQRIVEELDEQPYRDRLIIHTIDLSKPSHSHANTYDPVEHLRLVMRSFGEAVLNLAIQQETLPAASRQLIEAMNERLANRCLALFIDEIYEADWNFLELFEEYLLGPLAIDPRVLITMVGRGRRFPFSTPELRLFADSETLQPFDAGDIQALVERLNATALIDVDQIQSVSQGVPLTASFLAKHPDALHWPHARLFDTMIAYMLERAPESLRKTLRATLEALAVLHSFRDEQMIQTLLTTYAQTERGRSLLSPERALPASDDLVRMLVYQGVARYDVAFGAYVLDEHLHHLVKRFLQYCEPDQHTWLALHRAALRLFQAWTHQYDDSKDRWIAAIQYHQEALAAQS